MALAAPVVAAVGLAPLGGDEAGGGAVGLVPRLVGGRGALVPEPHFGRRALPLLLEEGGDGTRVERRVGQRDPRPRLLGKELVRRAREAGAAVSVGAAAMRPLLILACHSTKGRNALMSSKSMCSPATYSTDMPLT